MLRFQYPKSSEKVLAQKYWTGECKSKTFSWKICNMHCPMKSPKITTAKSQEKIKRIKRSLTTLLKLTEDLKSTQEKLIKIRELWYNSQWQIINYRKIKTITKSNMLSYRKFMLGYIDENRMSRRYFYTYDLFLAEILMICPPSCTSAGKTPWCY